MPAALPSLYQLAWRARHALKHHDKQGCACRRLATGTRVKTGVQAKWHACWEGRPRASVLADSQQHPLQSAPHVSVSVRGGQSLPGFATLRLWLRAHWSRPTRMHCVKPPQPVTLQVPAHTSTHTWFVMVMVVVVRWVGQGGWRGARRRQLPTTAINLKEQLLVAAVAAGHVQATLCHHTTHEDSSSCCLIRATLFLLSTCLLRLHQAAPMRHCHHHQPPAATPQLQPAWRQSGRRGCAATCCSSQAAFWLVIVCFQRCTAASKAVWTEQSLLPRGSRPTAALLGLLHHEAPVYYLFADFCSVLSLINTTSKG